MTADQAGLLRKAARNIRSAKVLLEDNDVDTAVARAYYAMFYTAEALLLSRGLSYSKHSAVIAAFGREFVKIGALPPEYHIRLIAASEARNISDYGIDSRLIPEDCRYHIANAEALLSAIASLLATTDLPA